MNQNLHLSKKESILLLACYAGVHAGFIIEMCLRKRTEKRYFALSDDYSNLIDKYNGLAAKYNDLIDKRKQFNEDALDCISCGMEKEIMFCDLTEALLSKLENGESIDQDICTDLKEAIREKRAANYKRLRSYIKIPMYKKGENIDAQN